MTTYAIDTHTGDGSQTDFTLSYNYFEEDDLIVKVDNVTKTSGTDYSIVDGSTVRFTSAPANGTTVTVERATDISNKKVTFSDGGTIRASDMNNQNDQLLFAVQEASRDSQNALRTNGTFYDAGNDRIANVGTPTASTDATTKAYVDQIETDATQQATNAAASASAALSHKNDAANSASAALASENAAAGSASTAATQAGNAASEAADALTAKNDAETAESNAQGHETNASGYASTAQAQAGIATTQAGIATTQAGNATTQAGNAATSATAAAASATDASDDADDAQKLAINPEDSQFTLSDGSTTGYSALHYSEKASDSAAAAAVSEGNASNAQAAAESARDSALASFDSFDDRYLGAKTSDPTVDNDGNALVAGALYFNSTDGEMKVYNGTSWVDAYADGASLVSKSGDTMTGNLSFGDNNKAIFGAGSDLQIYHSGTHSYIDDAGTGNLYIRSTNFRVNNAGDTQQMLAANDGGAVQLFDSGNLKLATTSTGIDVTGTVTADGLTVDTNTLHVDSTNNRVGIGTSSPVYTMHTHSAGNTFVYNKFTNSSTGTGSGDGLDLGISGVNALIYNMEAGNIQFATSGSERMRLESGGDLHVDGNVVAYSTTISDIRLKKDIAPIEDAVTKVQQLNGCTFTYLKDDRKSAGLIAQDVEKVLPSAVIEDEAVFHGEEGETYKTVQYDQLIGLLVEAVKELKAEIEELKDASSK